MTKQPVWKLVGQMGDVNALDYGGSLVFADQTGVYGPEVCVIVPPESDDETETEFYRFSLEKCTVVNGILSNNPYHPEIAAWFADKVQSSANTCGKPVEDVVNALCSDDPMERAFGYEVLWSNLGLFEFDQYPLRLKRKEAKAQYKRLTYKK